MGGIKIMKLYNSKFYTTTEILKEFFDLDTKLLYQMPEDKRYEKIYKHLVKLGAKYLGVTNFKREQYQQFKYQDSIYLIPNQIFQVLENQIFQIGKNKTKQDSNKVINLFKKAN